MTNNTINSELLVEATKQNLIAKSKSSPKGIQRFRRRVKSKVANSVREFNSIDMNKLFKDDILTVNINVKGETDNYVVKVSFSGFLEILHDELDRNDGKLDLKVITKALITGFNKEDVYVNCSCPDNFFRFSYWSTQNDYDNYALTKRVTRWQDKAFKQGKSRTNYSGVSDPQNIPAKITNPNDTLGSSCKHILLVLSNNSWILKVASVINNYIKYMGKHYKKAYADIIYPAIYQKEYEEPIQLDIFDTNRKYAKTGKDTLDKANAQTGRGDKGKFTSGNEFQFKSKEGNSDTTDIDQMSLFVDDEEEI